MKLKEIYSDDKPVISFEIFPPKKDENDLLKEIEILKSYQPAFISLTCGAGGKENKSFELLKKIKDVDLMPHFTCISSSKQSVEDGFKKLEIMGIENILALRGDIPENPSLICHEFNYANELVSFIKEKTNLSIGVAGYPEGHIESPDLKTNIENLKRKVDAGADAIFTQLFFANTKFYNYVDKVRKAGIDIPIVAGIMPMISIKQIEKMTSLARITLTPHMRDMMEMFKNNPYALREFGIIQASAQCEDLMLNGFNNFHFYTLNKTYSIRKILDQLFPDRNIIKINFKNKE